MKPANKNGKSQLNYLSNVLSQKKNPDTTKISNWNLLA